MKNSVLKTARAWGIKENLANLWSYTSPGWAKRFFGQWYQWAIRHRARRQCPPPPGATPGGQAGGVDSDCRDCPRFKDRDGGYTRIVKLSKPRLGDSGKRAILELVGVRDRKVQKSEKPAFSDEDAKE